MPRLRDDGEHVVLVTGASRGIGRALAAGLALNGNHVVGLVRRLPQDEAVAEGVHFLVGDIRSDEDCARVIAEVEQRYGRIDLLVNNAALGMNTLRSNGRDLWSVEPSQWQALFDTNLTGAFRITRQALRLMRGRRARVVNVSTSIPTMSLSTMWPYGPSKAALEALTAAWAAELVHDLITVNVVLPGGPCRTHMIEADQGLAIESRRLLDPTIVVAPVQWLLGADAVRVTSSRLIGKLWPHTPFPILSPSDRYEL